MQGHAQQRPLNSPHDRHHAVVIGNVVIAADDGSSDGQARECQQHYQRARRWRGRHLQQLALEYGGQLYAERIGARLVHRLQLGLLHRRALAGGARIIHTFAIGLLAVVQRAVPGQLDDASALWNGLRGHGNLFVKRSKVQTEAKYPDYGCNFEIYTEPDFLELETLGPLQSLAPGETAQHIEEWWLFRAIPSGDDDAWVDNFILPVLANAG